VTATGPGTEGLPPAASSVATTPPIPDVTERAAVVAARIELVQRRLRDIGRTGVLLSARRNTAWLSVGASTHIVLASEASAIPILVTASDAVALAPNNEADRLADEELEGVPIGLAALPWHDPSAIEIELRRRGADAPMTDLEFEPWLLPIRSVFTPLERERLRWLGGRVEAAIDSTLESIEPGSAEDAAVGWLLAALARDGIRAPVVLAAADDRIERYRHPLPTPMAIGRRLMLVAVAERWGLHVALTRFREFDPPPAWLAERIDHVANVLQEMIKATQVGQTLGDVFAVAREAYAGAGYPDEWTLHHQGGTIGYQPRERIALPGDATPITHGMAFAWNPSIRGAKSESTFVIGADGLIEIVTNSRPKGSTA
jgi:Xaa-Pro dipeptidase